MRQGGAYLPSGLAPGGLPGGGVGAYAPPGAAPQGGSYAGEPNVCGIGKLECESTIWNGKRG